MRLLLCWLFILRAHGWTSCRIFGSTRHERHRVAVVANAAPSKKQPSAKQNIPDDYERPYYPKPRPIDESLIGDLTGGRPGAIVETEEELEIKDRILKEIEDGTRIYPELDIDETGLDDGDYDNDDPEALDMATLATITIQDYRDKFAYEWDPHSDETDPNLKEMQQEGRTYLQETEKDEDGVEVGYDPMFGPSNPFDKRTIRGSVDSYMVDPKTRDESQVPKLFPQSDDPEIKFNQDVVELRKSLDILDTYIDPFLEAPVPRQVAKWHGYPAQEILAPRNRTTNLFTENPFDFDSLGPTEAKNIAVEFARDQNAEWLPEGVSQQWHHDQRQPYEEYKTLVGTTREGPKDPELVEQIAPTLKVLNNCAILLSIQDGIYRFHYHGLIKNKFGMERWTETMLRDCGVEVSNVIFEAGFRRRDPAYDGGDPENGPSFF